MPRQARQTIAECRRLIELGVVVRDGYQPEKEEEGGFEQEGDCSQLLMELEVASQTYVDVGVTCVRLHGG